MLVWNHCGYLKWGDLEVPIEFNNTSRGQNVSENSQKRSEPAIQFSQSIAPSNPPAAAGFAWLLVLVLVVPFIGLLLGLVMLQDARHSAARGNKPSVVNRSVIVIAIVISGCLSLMILLLGM